MALPQLKKILYFWDRTLGHTPPNRQQDIELLGVSINVCFWQASVFVIYALPGTLIAIKMKPKHNTKQTSRKSPEVKLLKFFIIKFFTIKFSRRYGITSVPLPKLGKPDPSGMERFLL